MSDKMKVGRYYIMADYSYYDYHIWVNRDSDNEVFIGLTDYAQKDLKDIVNIELPSPSQRFATGAPLVSIESISKEYLVKSPFSCIVLEVNPEIQVNPELINKKPYEAWLVRAEIIDLGQLDTLMDAEEMLDALGEEIDLDVEVDEDIEDFVVDDEVDDLYRRLTGLDDEEDPYDEGFDEDFYDDEF